MLSSLGFCFGSKGNEAETVVMAVRRGVDDGTPKDNDRREQNDQKQGSYSEEASLASAGASAGAGGAGVATAAASAAASLVASAATGGVGNVFHEQELERMFYLAMSAENMSETTTHSGVGRDSREGQVMSPPLNLGWQPLRAYLQIACTLKQNISRGRHA